MNNLLKDAREWAGLFLVVSGFVLAYVFTQDFMNEVLTKIEKKCSLKKPVDGLKKEGE